MKGYVKDMRHKTGMKSLFGRKNQKKDGTDGKVRVATQMGLQQHLSSSSLEAVHWTGAFGEPVLLVA